MLLIGTDRKKKTRCVKRAENVRKNLGEKCAPIVDVRGVAEGCRISGKNVRSVDEKPPDSVGGFGEEW